MSDNNLKEFSEYAIGELPKSDIEAKERYSKYKSLDPFPEIPPALLNSADIFKYVAATGMIYPFRPMQEKFRGATYAGSLKGECVYWNEFGIQKIEYMENKDDKIILHPNSITFVTLEPYFRIPEYIVLRFNLKIKHVYKGLLLGTGPIVDPGYNGTLSIPLHNLTLNTYMLKYEEELVWLEFTKLSPNDRWKNKISDEKLSKLCSCYIPFETLEKKDRNINDYIEKALKHSLYTGETTRNINNFSVRSSIPEKIKKAEQTSEDAKREANSANRRIGKISIFGIISLVVGLLGLAGMVFSVYSLVSEVNNYLREARQYETKVFELEREIEDLRRFINKKDVKNDNETE